MKSGSGGGGRRSLKEGSQRADLVDAIEVPVVVEQDAVVLQDELRDGAVDRAPDGQALARQSK